MTESSLPTRSVTVAVAGWIADRVRMEQVLDGWQDAMALTKSPH